MVSESAVLEGAWCLIRGGPLWRVPLYVCKYVFIFFTFPSFCFFLVGVGMNLTTKQLWNLYGLCWWSSCSVFRSDQFRFLLGIPCVQFRFSVGIPCVQFRFSVGIPCVVFNSHFPWGSLVFSSHFQWGSLVLCSIHIFSGDPLCCVQFTFSVGIPCVQFRFSVGIPCVQFRFSVGIPCVQFTFSVGIPCVVFSSHFQWGSLVLCSIHIFSGDPLCCVQFTFSVGIPCVQFRFSVGIPCVQFTFSVGIPYVVFSSHFQWGSLVFSSDFQWESLVLCAFVASWAFLFYILIMRSFLVNVFLWLNVLITLNSYLCFGFGTLLSSSTRMFTEWFCMSCSTLVLLLCMDSVIVMLMEVNGCLFILSPMVSQWLGIGGGMGEGGKGGGGAGQTWAKAIWFISLSTEKK